MVVKKGSLRLFGLALGLGKASRMKIEVNKSKNLNERGLTRKCVRTFADFTRRFRNKVLKSNQFR